MYPGPSYWELDALRPQTIAELIEQELNELVDLDAFEQRRRVQANQRKRLAEIADAETWR